MDTLTPEYLYKAEIWLLITTLLYFMVNGAGIFETVVIIPKWSASPPESFHLLRGKFGLDFKFFWVVMHIIHDISFMIAFVKCSQIDPIYNWLLILLITHIAVRFWTVIYFAPRIMAFQKMANSEMNIPDLNTLVKQTQKWRNLNYVRTGIFVLVSICLLMLYIKLLITYHN